MAYVVRVARDARSHAWLAPPNEGGFRTLAPRAMADVFPNREETHAAIATMPRVFEASGWIFSVEQA
jgi:hypothetical protein